MAVLLTFAAALLLGGLALTRLPVSLLPDVGIPRLSVQVSYPNASARTVEEAVVRPLRNVLLQVNDLTDIDSRTRDESAVLTLAFPFGTDPDLAFIEVNEKIDRAMDQLPRELPRPRVLASDVADIPVAQLSVTLVGQDSSAAALLDLSDLARRTLRRRLEQLPEVAFADLSGQLTAEVTVRPRTAALAALGLDERDLGELIAAANVELGGLLLRDGHYEYDVRLRGQLREVADLENLYLRVGDNRTLPLPALADIVYGPAPARGRYFADGRPGVVFTLRKRADGRLFDLQDHLAELLTDLRAQYPDLRFALANDQTALLRASIDNLTGGLLYGAGFAVLVLFLFFRGWRRPLLIAASVPVALCLALGGFYLAGVSVNVISLAGLILGLGLMIDNGIIVLDSMAQEGADAGATQLATAVETVIRPLVSSALTTVAVFLPLVLLSGVAGALFRDQAVAVTLSLVASLLVAYFLLPQLLLRLGGGRGSAAPPPSRWQDQAWAGFEQTVDGLLHRPWLLLPFFLLWAALGYGLYTQLPTRGFPELTRTEYRLRVEWETGVSFEEHCTRVLALNRELRRRTDLSTASFVGEQRFQLAEEPQATNATEVQLYFGSPPDPNLLEQLLEQLRRQYPAVRFTLDALPNLFDRLFANDAPYLRLRIRGGQTTQTPAPEIVRPVVERLTAAGFPPAAPARRATYVLTVDADRLLRNDVDPAALSNRLLTLFGDNEVTRLRTNDLSLPVRLGTSERTLTTERLRAATVTNRAGRSLPLTTFVSLTPSEEYRVLTADRAGEFLALDYTADLPPTAVSTIRELAAEPELSVAATGRFLTDAGRIGDLAGILLLSLALLYLILAAQFESLTLPFVVLLVVPVSLVGTLLALRLSGESLNLISLIGMVVTGGIVVNDAIIKVDMIERARRAGAPLAAAIHLAGRRRLRAIVMTSLTTVLALVPVLFSSGLGAELQRPLALAVIGGLAVGTVASLLLLPALYALLTRTSKPLPDNVPNR